MNECGWCCRLWSWWEEAPSSADISKLVFRSSSSMTCMLVELQPPGPELPAFANGKLILLSICFEHARVGPSSLRAN